ncbi:hypothetical protein AGABI2DRAFT_208052 [Agaricus bisporus var. bisporus H97]|uniref:hypothetical protein n=1 Tax=Agaricus bisporus var. bisporus (strain H97 / ATCC MYA-4626 / FGSC 10389) TaxID=936046 RepID=UPI00029F70EA|nr:hypothetical protein AGABI2DRAFT_208052 [Agaricus bisporus var. bisporus H97]EKV45198.1 hypothetical protein AGABI2DRAFT_208052 [Agaricus bisporus var. bisporus H97]
MQIAVLGGGLSGLGAAHALAHRFPAAQLLLFERGRPLGGWAQSLRHGRILLEGGPRTLRPNGAAALELIRALGIENQLLVVPKSSPASKNRYVYIRPGQLPGFSGLCVVGPSLLRQFLWPIIRAPLRYALYKNAPKDESVDSFMSRILGDDMATALGSALIHGIYAADSRQLSAHATLPFFSSKDRKKFLENPVSNFESDVLQPWPNVGNLYNKLEHASAFSFKDGMETLTRALEEHLEAKSNVQIFRESPVLSLAMRKDRTMQLSYLRSGSTSTSISTVNLTHVVSALPLPTLHTITQPRNTNDTFPSNVPLHLNANPSSSVHVLNLVFPGPPVNIHPSGFGYLIPRPREGYPTQATDAQPGILGVVFDSCTCSEQDDSNLTPEEWYHKGTHTKITVMLDGPYPLYIPPTTPNFLTSTTDIPHPIQIILKHLSTHFSQLKSNYALPPPTYYHLWRNVNCIPTYLPGHRSRMDEMKTMLKKDVSEGGWNGKLEVIGAGVDGVSVPDCLLAGRNAGLSWL